MAETYRTINIDVNKPEQSALVYSLSNQTRIKMGSATLGDQLPLIIRFLNNNSYDTLNGDLSYTWRVAIGDLGGSLYAQSDSWFPSSSYGLTGSLNLATDPLSASLYGKESITTTFEVEGCDSVSGKRKTYLQVPITIYNEIISSSISPVISSQYYTTAESDARYLQTAVEFTSSFLQGGNTFADNATLGTKDNYLLNIITNNTPRVTVNSDGKVGVNTVGTSNNFSVGGNVIADSFTGSLSSSFSTLIEANISKLTASVFLLQSGNITSATASNFTANQITILTGSVSQSFTDNNVSTRLTASNALLPNANITSLTATDSTLTRFTGSGDITYPTAVSNALAKFVSNKLSSSAAYEVNNNLSIGTATASSVSDAKFVVLRDITYPESATTTVGQDTLFRSNSTGSNHVYVANRGVFSAQTTAGVYSGKVVGIRGEATSTVNGANFAEAIGVQSKIGSATITQVTKSIGLLVERDWTLSTVQNDYGVYVATPSAGTYSNKYGLFVEDPAAKNLFKGNISVGNTGSAKLFIEGDSELDNVGLGMTASLSTLLNVTSSTATVSSLRLNPGVTVTSPVNGDVWNSAGLWVRDTGVTYHVPGVINRQTTTVTRNSATGGTQTLLSPSTTIPTEYIRVNDTYRVYASGYHSVQTPPTHSVQLRLSISGAAEVVLLDFGSISMSTNTTNGAWSFVGTFSVRSLGSSGTIVGDGVLTYAVGNANPTIYTIPNSTSGVVTFDSTISQLINLSVEMAGGDSNDKWECQSATIEIL